MPSVEVTVVASAAARGGAISGLACAETRVLARSSRGIEFAFCFRIGFWGGKLHCIQELSNSHRIFRSFPMCVAFRIGFCSVFADSRLFAHASLDFHLYFSSVQGWGGGGADDVHANADS